MAGELAFINGGFVPAAAALLPVQDAGFMLGVTVAEQMRTFGGKLFRLDEHVARLRRSLEIVDVSPRMDMGEMIASANQLVAHNHALLATGDDLGLSMFVTPGLYATFAGSTPSQPLVCMHTYPIPFQLFADKYEQGESLVVPKIRQVPPECWPSELKCRSRMHYFLADKEAQAIEPGARALLLDTDGNVSEASTASVFIYREGRGLAAPPEENILPGISLSVVKELASELNIPFEHCDLVPDDLASSDEVVLCSTSHCLLPVVRFQGQPVGSGKPGRVFRQLLQSWIEMAGMDFVVQAKQFAHR
jgi:branched-chain amino acid aminotransferase